ncbi:MAG: ABC transporter permease, partial [Blastocatellia bacterium]|nr:ABC transporter permease [Blastocatellia bacterium]
MKFIINLAYREMRASWHRLLFFFICIAIGVGSIVGLRSLVQNIRSAVGRESRSLLTADVQVSTNNPWNDETRTLIEKYFRSPLVEEHTEVVETMTMMRSLDEMIAAPKLIDVKAVQRQFPFYGELVLGDGLRYSHDLLSDHGVLVKPSLLAALNLKVGDKVRIGTLDFTIRGVIAREPGNAMDAFTLAPRVIVDYDDAVAAGLTAAGSRARYRTLFKTRDGRMETLYQQLRSDLQSQRLVTVRSFRYSQDRLSESLTRVEDYLSLIGLVILVLGGIGISSVTRVFIQQKLKTIAILKCLGGNNLRVLGAYLAQVLSLGLAGSLLGLLLAYLTALILPKYLVGYIPFNVEFGLTWQASLQGLGLGLMIALLFSLVPLLEIRRIRPILVLRSLAPEKNLRFDWVRIIAGLVVIIGLLVLASWQAGSVKVGAIFLGGLALMTVVLHLAATALIKFLRGLRHLPSFVLRQGINSLYRPGNQTRIILMAVGLGVFLIVAVRTLQLNLRSEFGMDLDSVRADLYMIDIQKDQRSGVEEIIKKYTGTEPQLIPTVRARIAAINNNEINLNRLRPNENRGMLGREYALTYRPYLEDDEEILAGKFWDETPSAEPEISIEELLHNELNLNLGDLVTFSIQGRKITARVSSIRRVDWRNARTGFLVVFRPGVLDDAPTVYLSAIKGPTEAAQRSKFQLEIVERYPN